MTDGAQDWVAVGPVDTFRPGRGRRVEAHGTAVAVFRVDDRVFAVANACPHMGAELADGKLDDRQRVICHMHDWTFELDTGICAQRRWASVQTFPARIERGQVWIGRPDTPDDGAGDDDDEWVVWDDSKHLKPGGEGEPAD